eukprot:CAMPEP_0183315142 /NCGR_PEP_ID=MMETSP0160_2-20130417/50784_1 /TAXON_ID=2839 ORGANISM="Odontella Sinensis, Strain Grunow 1884" /NCGR_SAMPLE_ID=MMETSP0160_2 /ASSEMBLY_ACC=CAM_ASM_000250 /LENGTH=73 /DNA_ID=CAMNT_0025480639 /DNA_START=52 /DNA_END=269 /DNA_ORIENTATION=-
MGKVTVNVLDRQTGNESSLDIDSQWASPISVWSDVQVTKDDVSSCTGKCTVKVTTHPQTPGRDGNKVKILTLS